MGAIEWGRPSPGRVIGRGKNEREYTAEKYGEKYKWTVAGEGAQPYQAGAFGSMTDAQGHAEQYETKMQEEDMAKRGPKKPKDATAAGAAAAQEASAAPEANGAPAQQTLTGAQRPGGIPRAKFEELLPCTIDAAQIDLLRIKLVAVTTQRVQKEAQLKTLKDAIKGLAETETAMVNNIEGEPEMRNVMCQEMLYTESNTVELVRLDTGEVLKDRTREATKEDRQEDMDRALKQAQAALAAGGATATAPAADPPVGASTDGAAAATPPAETETAAATGAAAPTQDDDFLGGPPPG